MLFLAIKNENTWVGLFAFYGQIETIIHLRTQPKKNIPIEYQKIIDKNSISLPMLLVLIWLDGISQ